MESWIRKDLTYYSFFSLFEPLKSSEVSEGTRGVSRLAYCVGLFNELPHSSTTHAYLLAERSPNTSVEYSVAIMAANTNEVPEGTLGNNQQSSSMFLKNDLYIDILVALSDTQSSSKHFSRRLSPLGETYIEVSGGTPGDNQHVCSIFSSSLHALVDQY